MKAASAISIRLLRTNEPISESRFYDRNIYLVSVSVFRNPQSKRLLDFGSLGDLAALCQALVPLKLLVVLMLADEVNDVVNELVALHELPRQVAVTDKARIEKEKCS